MKLTLSEDEKANVREVTGQPKGEVHIECCFLCGSIHWLRTETNKPDDVIVDPPDVFAGSQCRSCTETHRLHPTVVEWVSRVIGHQRRITDGPCAHSHSPMRTRDQRFS